MLTIFASSQKSPIQNSIELLSKIKKTLKDNEIAHEICREYGFEIDILDGIPIEFSDEIDSSAKTTNSCIQLNSTLLNEDFEIIMRYAIHELVHALQHMKLENMEKFEDHDYLDRPDELEAFQYQIKFETKHRGPEKAEEYANDLIEYHEIPEQEVNNKKKELFDKVE